MSEHIEHYRCSICKNAARQISMYSSNLFFLVTIGCSIVWQVLPQGSTCQHAAFSNVFVKNLCKTSVISQRLLTQRVTGWCCSVASAWIPPRSRNHSVSTDVDEGFLGKPVVALGLKPLHIETSWLEETTHGSWCCIMQRPYILIGNTLSSRERCQAWKKALIGMMINDTISTAPESIHIWYSASHCVLQNINFTKWKHH